LDTSEKKAILYMMLSASFFSFMQFFVKMSGDSVSIMTQVFSRNFLTLIISSIMIIKSKESFLPKKENIIWLLMRSIIGFLGIIAFFYATRHMLLAEANVLQRSSPVFVIIFSCLFLKVKFNKIYILTLTLALVGSIFVIRPKMDSSVIPSVIGLSSAVFVGASYTIIAFMKGKETGNLIIFYFALISSILSLSLVLYHGGISIPNTTDILILLAISITATLAQIFITVAYENGNPSSISIFSYFGIIVSFILSASILHEAINIFSIIGVGLIVVSALIVYLKKI